ncbi:MAG TPA: HAMP domain-containing protein [Firmicutes bacterium]|nr:HAMP domain-containing protein [Candidatus Fermentithermobacillaceae bacterium]
MKKLTISIQGIRGKILLGLLSVVVITSSAGIFLYTQMLRQFALFQDVLEKRAKYVILVKDILHNDAELADAVRAIITNPNDVSQRDRYTAFAKNISDDIAAIKAKVQTQENKASLERIEKIRGALVAMEDTLMNSAKSDPSGTLQKFNGEYSSLRDSFSKELEDFEKRAETRLDEDSVAVSAGIKRSQGVSIFVLAGSVAAALALGTIIANGMARPAEELVKVAETIADGDLTVQVKRDKARDEVGRLRLAIADMVNGLRTLIDEVAKSASEVAATSEELSASSEESLAAAEQIAQATENVAKAAQEQSLTAVNSARAIHELTEAITQVAKGAESQSSSVQEAAEATKDSNEIFSRVLDVLEEVGNGATDNAAVAANGVRAVENVVESINRIQSSTSEVSETVNDLAALSQEIRKITDVIDDIASQTNLLALNAAIEAARAGEHGRGFAVVADEIRQLAERSSTETKAISGLIDKIGVSIEKTVTAMSAVRKEVEEGNTTAATAGKALREIEAKASETKAFVDSLKDSINALKRASDRVSECMESISRITQEHSAATEEMTASAEEVKRLVEGVAATSQESAASAEEVSSSTEDMKTSIQNVASSAQALAEMAERLNAAIGKFRV